jgi:sporulation protein YlmC with PRC-barrel domain
MTVHHADLHLGAPVYSSDAKHVGSLERVLVDGDGMDLREIVVKESPIASGHHWYQGANMLIHDVVVPAGAVESATQERVTLNIPLSGVRQSKPYLSYKYVGASPIQIAAAAIGAALPLTYREAEDKPGGDLEIIKGENVMLGDTGRVLGHVHDVVYDDEELVGVVIRPSGLLTHDVLLQVRFLDRSRDDVLFAHISEEDLKHLGPVPAEN